MVIGNVFIMQCLQFFLLLSFFKKKFFSTTRIVYFDFSKASCHCFMYFNFKIFLRSNKSGKKKPKNQPKQNQPPRVVGFNFSPRPPLAGVVSDSAAVVRGTEAKAMLRGADGAPRLLAEGRADPGAGAGSAPCGAALPPLPARRGPCPVSVPQFPAEPG